MEARTQTARPQLDIGRLEDLLGFHLRMASAVVARDFALAMDGIDLTQKQCAVLELIVANPRVSQIDIGQTLGTDRATTMAIVDRLAAKGLVVRRRARLDGRRQELSLTTTGARLLAEARTRIDQHEKRFRRALGERQVRRLIDLLGSVCSASLPDEADDEDGISANARS